MSLAFWAAPSRVSDLCVAGVLAKPFDPRTLPNQIIAALDW